MMKTYVTKPRYIVAQQFNKDEKPDFVEYHTNTLPAGFEYSLVGAYGKRFVLRDGDYIVDSPDGYEVCLKEDFEKMFNECPI